jgi:thioesterase domain-containing protein/acyl carrier protein
MIPGAFVALPALPLGANGKVDPAALPAPDPAAGRVSYIAPVTDAERVAADAWADVLGVERIGVDDDFFALGGHSMLAVRLMTLVRRRCGVEVPLSALFERPTVRRLAPLVESGGAAGGWSPLVVLQPAGKRVPIFLVHPIGGQVLCYADLARSLGPDQPVYGLQAPDLTEVGEDEMGIEEMAASYVEAAREAWPHGPYLLGGWSFGGLVAFEMARQLAAAGEAVPLVALLDTVAPSAAGEIEAMEESAVLADLAREQAIKEGKVIGLTAAELQPLDPEARVLRTLEVLREAGVAGADVDAGWVRRLLTGHQVRRRALGAYRPGPYSGRLALFRPAESIADVSLPVNLSDPSGWRDYTTEPLAVHVVPGYHATMVLGANAASVADHLRAAADEALSLETEVEACSSSAASAAFSPS